MGMCLIGLVPCIKVCGHEIGFSRPVQIGPFLKIRNMSRAKRQHGTGQRRIAIRRSTRQTEARKRALAVLADMRRTGASLATASRREHIKSSTVRRYVGSALRQDRQGGRFRVTRNDRFKRELMIPTPAGSTKVAVYGSKAASELSRYANAVSHYLRTGDTSQLDAFKKKTMRIRGQEIELTTDPSALSTLAEREALHLDQFYASFAGAA